MNNGTDYKQQQERDDAFRTLIAERDALKTQLERAQARYDDAHDRAEAANAQMREALEGCVSTGMESQKKLVAALATDAGRSFVPIRDIEPLLRVAGLYCHAGHKPGDLWEALSAFLAKHGDKLKEAK